jgi:hypothetical protein
VALIHQGIRVHGMHVVTQRNVIPAAAASAYHFLNPISLSKISASQEKKFN